MLPELVTRAMNTRLSLNKNNDPEDERQLEFQRVGAAIRELRRSRRPRRGGLWHRRLHLDSRVLQRLQQYGQFLRSELLDPCRLLFEILRPCLQDAQLVRRRRERRVEELG